MGAEQSTALDQKIIELEQQLASTKYEASSSKASFEASIIEVEKLKHQISARQKVRQEMEIKLRKLMELEQQLSSTKSHASSAEASLRLLTTNVSNLKQQLLASEMLQQDTQIKLDQARNQLSLLEPKLQSNKTQLDFSNADIIQPHVFASINDTHTMEAQLQKVRDQLSLTTFELQSTTIMLQLSRERIKELEELLSICNNHNEDQNTKCQNVEDCLSTVKIELQSSKIELQSLNKYMKEVEHELSTCMKEKELMMIELGKLQDEHLSIKLQLESTKTQMQSSNDKVIQLQELQNVKNEICLATDELQSTKVMLQSSKQNAKRLKDEYSICKSEVEKTLAKKQRILNYLQGRINNSELKFTNNQESEEEVQIVAILLELEINMDHS